eukprot:1156328-Pelagomonas_calceolata.AAC.9
MQLMRGCLPASKPLPAASSRMSPLVLRGGQAWRVAPRLSVNRGLTPAARRTVKAQAAPPSDAFILDFDGEEMRSPAFPPAAVPA